jgi:hypothetical protein
VLELLQLRCDAEDRRVVLLGAAELEQLRGVGKAAADAAERADDRFQRLLFLAELLRALLVAPDLGVRERPFYLGEPLFLALEVKDTSAARPTGSAGRRATRRSG